MSTHAEHSLFCALIYGVFLYVVSSWWMRLMFRDAFQALEQGQRSNPSRWTSIFIPIILLSSVFFVFGIFFVR